MAVFNVNISAAAITNAIAAETAARISGDAASVATAAADATTKANAAQAAAIATAAADATAKANTAEANAIAASDPAGSAATVQGNLNTHTGNTSNPHSVTKAQVGLGSADNTSDANKPVSTAQQAALDLKAPLASPTFTGTVTLPVALTGPLRADAGVVSVDGRVQYSVMSGDATSTVVTLADVGMGLTATLLAGKKYLVEVFVTFRSVATTTGIGLTLNGSAAATMVNGRATYFFSQTQQTNYNIRAYDDFATSAGIDATGTNARASLDVQILNGASDSTLNVRFASEINASQITVEADGTYMRVTQMN